MKRGTQLFKNNESAKTADVLKTIWEEGKITRDNTLSTQSFCTGQIALVFESGLLPQNHTLQLEISASSYCLEMINLPCSKQIFN